MRTQADGVFLFKTKVLVKSTQFMLWRTSKLNFLFSHSLFVKWFHLGFANLAWLKIRGILKVSRINYLKTVPVCKNCVNPLCVDNVQVSRNHDLLVELKDKSL